MEIILNFTPTGMIPTKEMTPHVPLSVSEIVEDVHEAVELGVTMVHLHARATGANGRGSADLYGEMIEGIRAFAPDLVVGVSLSGRRVIDFERRAEPLELDGDLKPDTGSLTLSSLNFNREPSLNAPETIQALAQRMLEKGVLPELEAFDSGMINYAKYLLRKGMLVSPCYFNLLLGNVACAQADMLHAGLLVNDLPEGSYWSLAGIGDSQCAMNAAGIAFGGGARVGLEDNIYYDEGRTRLATNADLLRRVHRIIDAHEHRVMTPGRFRELLDLQEGNGRYGRLPSSLGE